MGLSYAPLQRFHHRKSTWPFGEVRLAPEFCPAWPSLSPDPVEDPLKNRPTLPSSDFEAPSGFLNLSTHWLLPMHPGHLSAWSHSWGSHPSEVSPSWLPTLLDSSTVSDFPFRGVLPLESVPAFGHIFFRSVPFTRIVSSGTRLDRRLTASSFEVACPSWHWLCLGVIPSCEGPAACSACLQGFELPESSFCHIPVWVVYVVGPLLGF